MGGGSVVMNDYVMIPMQEGDEITDVDWGKEDQEKKGSE